MSDPMKAHAESLSVRLIAVVPYISGPLTASALSSERLADGAS